MASSFGEAFEKAVSLKLNKQKVESDLVKDIQAWVKQTDSEVDARTNGSTVQIAVKGIQAVARANNITFLDLKPFFKNSSKVRFKKNGGWYLIVPIGVKARQLNQINSTDYAQLRKSSVGTTAPVGNLDKFQQVLQGERSSGLVNPVRYQWQSSGVTRKLTASGKRSSYISFRTVSDKSASNSWIVGRQVAESESLPAGGNSQMQADIKNLFLQAVRGVTKQT